MRVLQSYSEISWGKERNQQGDDQVQSDDGIISQEDNFYCNDHFQVSKIKSKRDLGVQHSRKWNWPSGIHSLVYPQRR